MHNDRMRVAVLDDWQAVARQSADWSALQDRADLFFFEEPFADQDRLAKALSEFDVIIAMRERTKFSKALIDRLPRLRMIALTGGRTWTTDFEALNARGIPMCHTGGEKSGAATAEIALGLLLGAARFMNRGDAAIRAGKFQDGVPAGPVLDGKTLGILGLGKIGSRMARYGAALGMQVIAWSENLTAEKARAGGARLVSKHDLLVESDALSLHVVLSERTRGILGAEELAKMKPGAILVNTSRGPLVDEAALVERLKSGRLVAGLDVFDEEPLPEDHPLRSLPNAMLTPHLGYGSREVYAQFYRESIDNVLAFLDGRPQRVLNPEALAAGNATNKTQGG
ncbi:MAG TPA: D-2-hydroxyacid dehydrogenase family protein [Burkholderiales bacterium]|nr:D-2-hydroxyacid dehydrogenase family protein [Burkholderiales bacterium]